MVAKVQGEYETKLNALLGRRRARPTSRGRRADERQVRGDADVQLVARASRRCCGCASSPRSSWARAADHGHGRDIRCGAAIRGTMVTLRGFHGSPSLRRVARCRGVQSGQGLPATFPMRRSTSIGHASRRSIESSNPANMGSERPVLQPISVFFDEPLDLADGHARRTVQLGFDQTTRNDVPCSSFDLFKCARSVPARADECQGTVT